MHLNKIKGTVSSNWETDGRARKDLRPFELGSWHCAAKPIAHESKRPPNRQWGVWGCSLRSDIELHQRQEPLLEWKKIDFRGDLSKTNALPVKIIIQAVAVPLKSSKKDPVNIHGFGCLTKVSTPLPPPLHRRKHLGRAVHMRHNQNMLYTEGV